MRRWTAHHHRHGNVNTGSIFYLVKGGLVDGRCPAARRTQKTGNVHCSNVRTEREILQSFSRRDSHDGRAFHRSLCKEPMLAPSYPGSISLQYCCTHSGISGGHLYSEFHARMVYCWHCRNLRTLVSQAPADSKHEVGCEDASKATWELLASRMQALQGGLAKGKELEALKGLVDQLLPLAEPTDLRLGLACLRVALSLAATRVDATLRIGYAQRALRCLETLEGSLDHAICLLALGSANYELAKFDKALLHLRQCVSIIHRMKGTRRDDFYELIALNAYQLLGQLESVAGNFHESLVQYQHAISIGQKVLKEESPQLASIYFGAGTICRELAHTEAAMVFAQKALEAFMTCYGPSSLQVGRVRSLMSGLHCDLLQYEDALLHFNEAKPILEHLEKTVEVAKMNVDIASLLMYWKRYDAAMPFLEEAIKCTDLQDAVHVTALMAAAIASTKLELECAPDYCRKVANALGDNNVKTALSVVQLGRLCMKKGKIELAIVLFQKALDALEKSYACPSHSVPVVDKAELQQLGADLGVLLLRTGRVKKAICAFETALTNIDKGSELQLFIVHFLLGASYNVDNQRPEASKHFAACSSMMMEWLCTSLVLAYYNLAIKSWNIHNMGLMENVGLCILWLLT